jgi:hypothetical protein
MVIWPMSATDTAARMLAKPSITTEDSWGSGDTDMG